MLRQRTAAPAARCAGMPRVYFHLFNDGGAVLDEEGREVVDMTLARAKAVQEIRSIIGEEAKQGIVDLRGRIEMTSDTGELVGVVLFTDAVRLLVGPSRQ